MNSISQKSSDMITIIFQIKDFEGNSKAHTQETQVKFENSTLFMSFPFSYLLSI